MKKTIKLTLASPLLAMLSISTAYADGHASDVYANFPITLQGYSGDAKTSESYGGQMARHMLHNGLKKVPHQVICQKWRHTSTAQKVCQS